MAEWRDDVRLVLAGVTCFAPSPPPYAFKCCTLWGLEEERLRRAWTFREGQALANGRGSIPLKYFLAVCDTPEEAGRRHFQASRARAEAAAGFKG